MVKSSTQQTARSTGTRSSYARSQDTRAKILAAALEEASDSGFHKTSVARIAARAGVAVGILNYHFGSRSELLRELIGSLVADLLSRLHVALPEHRTDFFELERAGLLVYLEYLRANPAYVRLADEVKLHDPKLYRDAVNGWVGQYITRIRAGIEAGSIRSMTNAEIVAQGHFLLGIRHFLDQMMNATDEHPYPGDEAVVDAYLGLIRNGLGKTSPTD